MIQLTLTRRTLALVVALLVAVAALATGAFVRAAQADHRFNDIADGTFYHDSTAWLADNGIANGFPDGSFGTQKTITRGQASFWFNNFNDNIVTPHVADTTDVHGIPDTAALATDSDLSSAVAAEAAKRVWARIDADSTGATLLAGSGVTTQGRFSPGVYYVQFNQDPTACGWSVSLNDLVDPANGLMTAREVRVEQYLTDFLIVRTFDSAGAVVEAGDDDGFTVEALC